MEVGIFPFFGYPVGEPCFKIAATCKAWGSASSMLSVAICIDIWLLTYLREVHHLAKPGHILLYFHYH